MECFTESAGVFASFQKARIACINDFFIEHALLTKEPE
jgi:hypothetical protein